jgi:hypothetical protein
VGWSDIFFEGKCSGESWRDLPVERVGNKIICWHDIKFRVSVSFDLAVDTDQPAFFAMYELAMVFLLAKSGSSIEPKMAITAAKAALELIKHPNRCFPQLQVGITLVGIFPLGALGGARPWQNTWRHKLKKIPLLAPYSEGLALVVGGANDHLPLSGGWGVDPQTTGSQRA